MPVGQVQVPLGPLLEGQKLGSGGTLEMGVKQEGCCAGAHRSWSGRGWASPKAHGADEGQHMIGGATEVVSEEFRHESDSLSLLV